MIPSLMNNKKVYSKIKRNRVLKTGWCFCGLLALLVFQSCGITDSSSSQVYILSTVNNVEVTADKEAGIVGGMITLNNNGNIERKLNYRMQDGSELKNVREGTYKVKGNELKIEFENLSIYEIKGNEIESKQSKLSRWSPPNGKLDGNTLIFYNPCVNCFGPPDEEVYVRQ
jgi:hypothetical protein